MRTNVERRAKTGYQPGSLFLFLYFKAELSPMEPRFLFAVPDSATFLGCWPRLSPLSHNNDNFRWVTITRFRQYRLFVFRICMCKNVLRTYFQGRLKPCRTTSCPQGFNPPLKSAYALFAHSKSFTLTVSTSNNS